jgi:hypothetical protein
MDNLLQTKEIIAQQIQDHRLIYLDYEGEISGNRGYVKIFDNGKYIVKKIENNFFEFELSGNILKGSIKFSLHNADKKLWKIIYEKYPEKQTN